MARPVRWVNGLSRSLAALKQEGKMLIGGYTMNDDGVHGITVTETEAGWSFYMQGDDADNFRSAWELAKEYGSSFGDFLYDHEYNTLFQ